MQFINHECCTTAATLSLCMAAATCHKTNSLHEKANRPKRQANNAWNQPTPRSDAELICADPFRLSLAFGKRSSRSSLSSCSSLSSRSSLGFGWWFECCLNTTISIHRGHDITKPNNAPTCWVIHRHCHISILFDPSKPCSKPDMCRARSSQHSTNHRFCGPKTLPNQAIFKILATFYRNPLHWLVERGPYHGL